MKIMQELFRGVWKDEETSMAENVLDITLAVCWSYSCCLVLSLLIFWVDFPVHYRHRRFWS